MSVGKYYVCLSCKKSFDRKPDQGENDDQKGFCPHCGREMKVVQYTVWR